MEILQIYFCATGKVFHILTPTIHAHAEPILPNEEWMAAFDWRMVH